MGFPSGKRIEAEPAVERRQHTQDGRQQMAVGLLQYVDATPPTHGAGMGSMANVVC